MGNEVDTENDGQPSPQVNGDGSDDDGVIIPTLIPGSTATFVVNVNDTRADRDGVVSVWIDFKDGNGLVQVITDQAVTNGSNELTIPVPATAGTINDRIYIRVRFGSETGLGSTGAAIDGEVEGYLVRLGVEPTNTPEPGPTDEPTDEPTDQPAATSQAENTPVPPIDESTAGYELQKTVSPAFAEIGDTVTWTIEVRANGNTPTGPISFTDDVPGETVITNVTTNIGRVLVNGQQVSYSVDSLQPGNVARINIVTQLTSTNSSVIDNSVLDKQATLVVGVQTLPATGETPLWRSLIIVLLALGTMTTLAVVAKRRNRQKGLDT